MDTKTASNPGVGVTTGHGSDWLEPVAKNPGPLKMARKSEITIHQLRIFWAVAHSSTLTQAAKQLGLAQPSLSQQLSKLETNAGTKLFHRRSSEMTLTESGQYLLPEVEHVLRTMRDLEDGLQKFSSGQRVTIRLAGINSVLRILLPEALKLTRQKLPDIEFDIQESAPSDVLEMLYGRSINLGLIAANSVAEAGNAFLQVPLIDDPYVLVVPEQLDLSDISDPNSQLSQADQKLLNQTVKFVFGTKHAKRVEQWYDEMIPDHALVAQCRSFEVAVGLVRAGSGICLAPALSTLVGPLALDGVRLYKVSSAPRQIVALIPSQYRRQEPYATLVDALQSVGAQLQVPEILPSPPFLHRATAIEV